MMISFKSKITIKLLDYYFLNPDASHYINELAHILEVDPKNLHRKLVELENEGLFFSEFHGKERFFCLNKNFALLSQYKDIFAKTLGIEHKLRKIVSSNTKIKKAFIFGSYAKNTMDAESDVDLFLVGSHQALDLQKRVYNIEKETGREINVVNMGVDEFERKQKKDFFVREVLKDKIIELKK